MLILRGGMCCDDTFQIRGFCDAHAINLEILDAVTTGCFLHKMRTIRISRLNLIISFIVIFFLYFTFKLLVPEKQISDKFTFDVNLTRDKSLNKPCTIYYQPIGMENHFPNLIETFKVPRKESIYIPRKTTKTDYDTIMRLLNLTLSIFEKVRIW